jgi:hypothetical protein
VPSLIGLRCDQSHAAFDARCLSLPLLRLAEVGLARGAAQAVLPTSVSIASLKSLPSRCCASLMTSPPTPHWRQFQICFRTLTPKRSLPPHVGHGPISSAPARLSLMPRRATSSSIGMQRAPVPTQSALLKFFDKRAEVRLLVPAKKRVASCQADPLPPTPLGLVARPWRVPRQG